MASEDCLRQIIPGIADEGLLVEVGVLRASNLVALALAFPQMRLIGIDSYEAYTDPLHGNYTVTEMVSTMNREIAERRIADSGHSDRIELRVLRSDVAATQIADQSVDFVYLDKNFTESEQFSDVVQWYPKVRQGGVLAGHEAQTPEIIKATQTALRTMGVTAELTIVHDEVWYLLKV